MAGRLCNLIVLKYFIVHLCREFKFLFCLCLKVASNSMKVQVVCIYISNLIKPCVFPFKISAQT